VAARQASSDGTRPGTAAADQAQASYRGRLVLKNKKTQDVGDEIDGNHKSQIGKSRSKRKSCNSSSVSWKENATKHLAM
jgi:predicted transcriptional regulator